MKFLKKQVYYSVRAHSDRYEKICDDLWKNYTLKDYSNIDFKKKMVLRDYHFYCANFQYKDNRLLDKNKKKRIYNYSLKKYIK